ncbi:MAG: lipopolysaccharide biosynthesis protein [Luteibaculaceae bacterium]
MFKSVFTSTLLYALVGLLPAVMGFVLLPIYLNILSAEEYGLYALINAFSTILGVVMGLKLESAFRVFYFDFEKEADQEKYLHSVFTAILLISAATLALLIPFGDILFKTVFGPEVSFFPLGLLASINVFIASVTVLYAIDCQNKEKRKAFVWYSFTATAITIAIQYLGIVVFNLGVIAFFVGILVSSSLQLAYIVCIGKFRLVKVDFPYLKSSLRYSIPLIPFLFLLAAEQQLDRFFLKKFHSLELLGIYALLLTCTGVFTTLINSLDNAIRPKLFISLKQEDKLHNVQFYQYLYMGISFAVVVGVSLLAYILPYWIGNEKYMLITKSIPLYSLSLIPMIYVRFYAMLFTYKKDSSNLSLLSLVKLLALIPIFYLLVPNLAIDGILLALFIANMINAALFFGLIKLKHKLQVAPSKDLILSLLVCGLLIVYWIKW